MRKKVDTVDIEAGRAGRPHGGCPAGRRGQVETGGESAEAAARRAAPRA